MKTLIYIAGPYSNDNPDLIDENIGKARQIAIILMDMGYGVIVPHLNTFKFENNCKNTTYEDFQELYLKLMIRSSDAVLFIPGWQDSKGCKMEKLVADALDLPVYTVVNDLIEDFPPSIVPDEIKSVLETG
jgi:hypothetical protein